MSHNINYLYKKLSTLDRRLKKILTEAELAIKEKPSDISVKKGVSTKEQFKDKSGVVVNFKKLTKATNKETEFILTEGIKLIQEEGQKAKELSEVVLRDIVADLTKIKNEMAKANEDLLKTKSKEMTDIRNVFKLYATRYIQSKNKIKEYQRKIDEKRNSIKWEEYEQKLEDLRIKYNMDKYEEEVYDIEQEYGVEEFSQVEMDLTSEINNIEKESKQNYAQIDKEAKDTIRKVRQIIEEMYDVPSELVNTADIFIKAMGVVAKLSTISDRYLMKKEGFEKILNNPTLMTELGEFIETTEYSDRVNFIGTELSELGTYFSEVKLKVDNQVKSFEQSEKELNENVFSEIGKKAVMKIAKVTKTTTALFKNWMNKLTSRIDISINKIVNNDKNFENKNKEFLNGARKAYVSVNKELEKLKLEQLSDLEKKFK